MLTRRVTKLGVLQRKTTNVLANYLVSDLSKSVDSGGLTDFRYTISGL
jgi:hypothetical protein